MNNTKNTEEQGAGISVADIYYVLFRQKWIILAFLSFGVIGTAILCVLKPSRYESEAKLYVQYVRDGYSREQANNDTIMGTTDSGNSVIETEKEILTSLDLANQVVANIGAQRVLAAYGGGNDTNAAAAVIVRDLLPDSQPKGSMVRVTYQHPDKEVAQSVLHNVIDAYIIKSADLHRPADVSSEYFNRETERLHNELAKTEQELKQVNDQAGIITTLADWKRDVEGNIDIINRQLIDVRTQLAGRMAETGEVSKPAVSNTEATNVDADLPAEVIDDYKANRRALDGSRQEYERMLATVPIGSPLLDGPKRQMQASRDALTKLEKLYPSLKFVPVAPVAVTSTTSGAPGIDPAAEVRNLSARAEHLDQTLAEYNKKRHDVELLEPRINELTRIKQAQEKMLNGLLDSMVASKTDTEKKYSAGIKVGEWPTPAAKKRSKSFKKLFGAILGGSVGGGLGLAFLIEMIIDRSVRRPSEIEKKLKLPLFVTIPDINRNGHRKALASPVGSQRLLTDTTGEALVPHSNGWNEDVNGGNGHEWEEIAPWDRRHALQGFCSGLRDRLIVNFEVRNLNHNPKLVAVTSCGRGAGVSTIAAGLAASLSETGDGNVLLVDMNGESGAAQHFYKGTPGCGLDDALESDTQVNAFVQDNLYVATEPVEQGNIPGSLSKHFASLMPKLKASQYDYIIFDMPPVSQTSMTARLSGLMDMVLLVIESEKTSKDTVERANALLNESKATVSTVLNKVRSYIPPQLHREVLDGE